MDWSTVLGWILVVLGAASVSVGFFVALITTIAKAMRQAFGIRPETLPDLPWEKIVDLLRELLAKPGGVFFVTGFAEIGLGIFLLERY